MRKTKGKCMATSFKLCGVTHRVQAEKVLLLLLLFLYVLLVVDSKHAFQCFFLCLMKYIHGYFARNMAFPFECNTFSVQHVLLSIDLCNFRLSAMIIIHFAIIFNANTSSFIFRCKIDFKKLAANFEGKKTWKCFNSPKYKFEEFFVALFREELQNRNTPNIEHRTEIV